MHPDLTPTAIALIRAQFARLKDVAPAFVADFYTRLFQIAPSLRALFPTDIAAQEQKLLAALAFTVAHLDRPDDLEPVLHAIGARHVGYGAAAADFAPVGEALIAALAAILGSAFDASARQAWLAAYLAAVGKMSDGMASVESRAA